MTRRLFHYASLLIATLVLAVAVVPAQTPDTQTPNTPATNNTNAAGKLEFRLPPLQTRPQQRTGFSLRPASRVAPAPQGPLVPLVVLGGGTPGRLAKWTNVTLVNSFIGDSSIFEDSAGKVGIGTTTPTSPLTVQGMIETKLGGIKFPDGTVQTTAGPGMTAVAHDQTLKGNGTAAAPLGVAVPLVLSGSSGLGIIQATNTGIGGSALYGLHIGSNGPGVIGEGKEGGGGVFGGSDDSYGVNALSLSLDPTIAALLARGIGALAGLFDGNVAVQGTLSKTAGTFKIDHPLDPQNKYLYHSFVESPDMLNIYNGNITTNGNGEAIVTLPDYFEALNKDFRYQLTAIGAFAQAIVAEEITDNRFTIRTNAPNVKVSWQVTGVRQDAYANKHRIQIEEAKPERERGTYLHPEAFNQPEERGVEWARNPQMMQQLKQRRIEVEQTRKQKQPDR